MYFSTKDKLNEQLMLLECIRQLLVNYSGQNIIIGGDFNTCLNFNTDKKSPPKERIFKYNKELNNLMNEMELIDSWRIQIP